MSGDANQGADQGADDVDQQEQEQEQAPGPGPAPDPADAADLGDLVARVPTGWTEVAYGGHAWGLTRTDRAQGGTTSIYAEELGGPGVVSANVWRTSSGELLRPCEMPAEVVLDFLRGWTGLDASGPDATDR